MGEARVALVTGASSGIGLATCWALAEAGFAVVAAARRTERLTALVDELQQSGHQAGAVRLDLTAPESIDSAAQEAGALFGPIEVLVSNAGNVVPTTVLATTETAFEESIQLHLLGVHRLLRQLSGPMLEAQRGDIVVVTSNVTAIPRTNMAPYVASKAASESMARVLQLELEGTGVRCGIVRPGPTGTEQGADWSAEQIHEVLAEWKRRGHLRHDGVLPAQSVANAIVTMVSAPLGTHLSLIEVEPEAPLRQ